MYVHRGAGDFSIGPLQMKPSFAERIEDWSARVPAASAALGSPERGARAGIEEERRGRLDRLRRLGSQCDYLAAFYLICMDRFPELASALPADRVAFLSAAYNAGFHLGRERIEAAMGMAIFPPPPGWPDPVAYVSLSVGWFGRQEARTRSRL